MNLPAACGGEFYTNRLNSQVATALEAFSQFAPFPYISKVLNQYRLLTPTEIAICNMIRSGLRTIEIAKLRNISLATVNRHRENIHKKLKNTNNNINLITYLQSNP
jgi:DNA-binding NarL/FixJ family response regulator